MDRSKWMDPDEATRLLSMTRDRAAQDLRAGRGGWVVRWMLVDLALETGLRVSELARLTVGDHDPKRRSLRVWRHKRRRPVQETLAVSPDLAGHLAEFIEWKRLVGQPVGGADRLLMGKRGPLTADGLARSWKAAVANAKLPASLSIHCARHTVATQLLRRTGNLVLVQRRLGHTSPAVTANLYCGLDWETEQRAVDGLYRAKDGGQ